MGLIKGLAGINKLLVGYPTVSDKYDVGAGTLEGQNVKNGDVVMFGSAHGVYKKAANVADGSKLAGIVLATNVKTPNVYPCNSETVETVAGEAFNLMVRGFVAVKLDEGADLGDAVEGAPVYITADGNLTTVTDDTIETAWKFMGVNELHGEDMIAEIVL